jgi:hypothetical protein
VLAQQFAAQAVLQLLHVLRPHQAPVQLRLALHALHALRVARIVRVPGPQHGFERARRLAPLLVRLGGLHVLAQLPRLGALRVTHAQLPQTPLGQRQDALVPHLQHEQSDHLSQHHVRRRDLPQQPQRHERHAGQRAHNRRHRPALRQVRAQLWDVHQREVGWRQTCRAQQQGHRGRSVGR